MGLVIRQQPDALSELYDRYSNLVFSVALRVINDHAAAEEITLDVFTRVWERASLYEQDRASLGTWLATLARNKGIDALRRLRSRPENWLDDTDEQAAASAETEAGPEEQTEIGMERARVRRAMADLPPDQRQTLEMAYFQGLTHREISEMTGAPLGTVKTRMRLAMQKLRQALGDENETPD